jgi:hypothetical protein
MRLARRVLSPVSGPVIARGRRKEDVMTKAKRREPLALVGRSVRRMQSEGGRVVGRLQRDAQTLIARSRAEILKEVKDLERRVVKVFHAATEEQVVRLERRVAKLEAALAAAGGKRTEGSAV